MCFRPDTTGKAEFMELRTKAGLFPALLVGVFCFAASALAQAPSVDPASGLQPSYFGTRELRASNLEAFKQWNGALQRFSKESAEKLEGSCEEKRFNACNYLKLKQFLDGIRSKDRMSQIVAVNALINKAKYVSDDSNWNQRELWNSPGEFMARFGDCEDFAIAKFVALEMLGFSQDQKRVVAVKDLNLKVGHAILVVFLDGKIWVLDNQIPQVIEASKIRHYDPVFSINQKYWWRHMR
jgi:predicted transglutaminase-like cysteine proteinase